MPKICAKLGQTKTPVWDGAGHKDPPLAEEILAVDSCWERMRKVFVGGGVFSGMQALREPARKS